MVSFKRLCRFIRKCWWFYVLSSGILIASLSYPIWNRYLRGREISQDLPRYGSLLEEPTNFKEFGRVIDEPLDIFDLVYSENENSPNHRFVFVEEETQFSYLTPLGKNLKEEYSDLGLGILAILVLIILTILLWKLLKRMIYSIVYIFAKAINDAKKHE